MLLHEMHAYGGDLTQPIIRWCRSGLEYIRKGIPSVTKAGGGKGRRLGVDIDRLMDNVDDATREAILHESRGLASNTRLRKGPSVELGDGSDEPQSTTTSGCAATCCT